MDNLVITVARGFGSCGKRIAKQIADDLGIHCYENRILMLASQMSGLDEEVFAEVNEKLRSQNVFSAFLKGLPMQRSPKVEDRKFVSDEKLFEYQKQIIEQLADTESCVIVGKCADWILKDRPNVISLYIEAPRRFTLKEIMDRMGVNEATAARSITLNDLDAMEAELKKEDVACVIIESLLATYGFPIPDKGYLAGVKKLCEKYGTLYIADETQTGLMRTGKMWCFEHEGFVPDMITTAKGFGGGIYPISATVMNRKAASWMFDIGRMHGSTCGNSELGCVVAMKVLEISTRKETVDNINKNAKLLTERVNALIDKYDGFITGYTQRGVIMGINFDCEDASKTVCKPLFDNGVWSHNSRLHPNTLQLKLGLLCDDAFMDELFEKIDKGLAQALSK